MVKHNNIFKCFFTKSFVFKIFVIIILVVGVLNVPMETTSQPVKNSIPLLRYSNTLNRLNRQQRNSFVLKSELQLATTPISNDFTSESVSNQKHLKEFPMHTAYTFSIPRIGIQNSVLAESSLRDIAEIDNKLLYNAVLENQISNPPCTQGHAYIYGHSEPALDWQKYYPASYIFNNLHILEPGDIIKIQNKNYKNCVYKVTHWDQVETTIDQKINPSQLNFIFNPGNGTNLTIQTCKLGSATIRNLLRAELIHIEYT